MFEPGNDYRTRSGHSARVLHKCDSVMHQILGYITLSDGEEVPVIWTSQGESFSRALGYSIRSDEFDLIQNYEAEP